MAKRVSLLTPTFNRGQFLPILIKIVQDLDYPHELIDWILIDDGSTDHSSLFTDIPYARYYFLKNKITLAKKRNMLNLLANGEYLICIDDDDYYPPSRITHAISAIQRGYQVVGSKDIYTYYIHDKSISRFRQGTYGAATLAYTKEYAMNHRYGRHRLVGSKGLSIAQSNIINNSAEESAFLHDVMVGELDPVYTILVISHKTNTIDKRYYRGLCEKGLSSLEYNCTGFLLKNFVRNQSVLEFYKQLTI